MDYYYDISSVSVAFVDRSITISDDSVSSNDFATIVKHRAILLFLIDGIIGNSYLNRLVPVRPCLLRDNLFPNSILVYDDCSFAALISSDGGWTMAG